MGLGQRHLSPQNGEVIAQGPNGLPIFIVVMQHTVQAVLKSFAPETMQPGDVFIVNDPYSGGTHTMDVKLVKPYFRDGRLTMFVANTGHWPDVGGMTPGGFTPASTDVYQEGLRMPPVRLIEAGRMNESLLRVMLLNMRSAEDRRGDLAAQLNSLEIGCKRLDALFDRFSRETVFECVAELKGRSEALMRRCHRIHPRRQLPLRGRIRQRWRRPAAAQDRARDRSARQPDRLRCLRQLGSMPRALQLPA